MSNTENIIPTNDIVFQLLFGKNKNKCITNDFIKSILNFVNENTNLSNIHINSEFSLEKLTLKDRRVRLDILTEYDEQVICIEMQNKDYENNKYINIGLKFIFVFLPKLKELKGEILNNDFYMWLKFLEYTDMEVIDEMAEKNENIKRAQREMFMISAEEEEKTLERFHENYLMERKFDRAEAREEGIEEGKKEGREEGQKEGFKKAIINFAKKMLAEKYSIQEIINLTGLSEREINKLAKTI